MGKLWFSIFDKNEYSGEEPTFFDVSNKECFSIILNNQAVILTEFQNHLKKNKRDYSPYFNKALVSKKGSWKTIVIKFCEFNNYKNQKKFPKTTAIINQVPNLISASFSKLEAGVKIKPHSGDCNGYYRCHLGLLIPSGLPEIGFRVKSEKRAWEQGKLFAFCDAYEHEAFNFSDEDRYIFTFDVIREEYAHEQKNITGTILASILIQKLYQVFIFSPKKPRNKTNKPSYFSQKILTLLPFSPAKAKKQVLIISIFMLKPLVIAAKTIFNMAK